MTWTTPKCDGFVWKQRFEPPSRSTIIGPAGVLKQRTVSELQSRASRLAAAAAERQGLAERVHEQRLGCAMEEMLRQRLRRQHAAEAEAQRASLLASPPVPPAGFVELVEALTRVGAGARANVEAEEERRWRMAWAAFDAVAEQLLRTTARRRAAAAMDAEQAACTARRTFATTVVPAIRSRAARAAAAAAASAEQAGRTARVVPPPPGYHALMEALSRRGAAAMADEAAELERCERVHVDRLAVLCDELRRAVNAERADMACDEEQAARIATQHMRTAVLPQLLSQQRRAAAAAAAAREQRRAGGGVRDAHAVAAFQESMEEVQRLGARVEAAAAAAQGRAEQIHEQRYAAVCEELIRSTAAREADAAAELEQAQRVAAAQFAATLADISRIGALWTVYAAVDGERLRRCHASPPTPQQMALKGAVNAAVMQAVPVA